MSKVKAISALLPLVLVIPWQQHDTTPTLTTTTATSLVPYQARDAPPPGITLTIGMCHIALVVIEKLPRVENPSLMVKVPFLMHFDENPKSDPS